MKKKVLHLLNSTSYSGAENVVISIINNMKESFEFAYASPNGQIKNNLEKENIYFMPIKNMSVSEIRRITKKYNPNVIHAHDYTASIIAALSGVNIPIISHLHNNLPWIKTYHPYSFIYYISTIKYYKILGVSNSVFEEYVFGNKILSKSLVVSNPIDTKANIKKAKVKSKNEIRYDIVFLGRLSEQKNPLRFIKLIEKLLIKYPDTKIAMIGDGSLKLECQSIIDEKNLSGEIHLLGFLDNPYGILSNAKVLCMTSKWEGFGLVAVEALSLGVPVLATPVGGLPGIVDNNCGFITDNDGEYVNELIQLLTNKEYWKRKSLGARMKSKELDNIKNYMENLGKIYNCK